MIDDFPGFPLLTNDVVDPAAVTAEYVSLCGEYGYDVGVSFRKLLDHDYRQGMQVHELMPDAADRAEAADQHSAQKGARA